MFYIKKLKKIKYSINKNEIFYIKKLEKMRNSII